MFALLTTVTPKRLLHCNVERTILHKYVLESPNPSDSDYIATRKLGFLVTDVAFRLQYCLVHDYEQ